MMHKWMGLNFIPPKICYKYLEYICSCDVVIRVVINLADAFDDMK